MKTISHQTELKEESFVTRAHRAMVKAAEKARQDYKRFGIEPVEVPFQKKKLSPTKSR